MPKIQEYTQQNTAQGNIAPRQATGVDYGAGVGVAQGNIGNAFVDAGNTAYQLQQQDDVTGVHVAMAKAQADWEDKFKEAATQAQPGTKDFAKQVGDSMSKYFSEGSQVATTRAGQSLYTRMSSNMESYFQTKAIGFQANLDGEYAKVQYTGLIQNLGRFVYGDEKATANAQAQGIAAIDDPNGIFSRVDEATRARFRDALKNDLDYATGRGYVQRNPGALTGAFSPEQTAQFSPHFNFMKEGAVPGGQFNVHPDVMKWAPVVANAAASRGVNANIMMAQIDQESKGNPDAVSPKGATGVSQFTPETAAQYKIDPKDPNASIGAQATYMGELLQTFGGDYSKALAGYNWGPGNVAAAIKRWGNDWLSHAPEETKTYVSNIFQKSGMVATDGSTKYLDAPRLSDIRAKEGTYDPSSFGKRPDGSAKGGGFLGVLKRPDGGVSTEISIGVNINGTEMEIPTLVPTLTRDEVNTLLSTENAKDIPDSIVAKAIDFATKRMAEGKSVFAGSGETPIEAPIKSNTLPFMNRLSWEQQDHLINEDVRVAHMRMQMANATRMDAKRESEAQQESVMNNFTKRIFDPKAQGGPVTDVEIVNDKTLTSPQKQHIINIKLAAARNDETATHASTVAELYKQIHAADDDPMKSYNMDAVNEAFANGKLSPSEYKDLRREVTELKDGASNGFTKEVQSARNTASYALQKSIVGQMQPELAVEAAYRFNNDMQAKIEQFRKENKDPRSLLDPESKDYLLKTERIMSFMKKSANALVDEANKVIELGKSDRTPVEGYTVGATYKVNGKNSVYLGGALNLSTSWK